MSFPASPGRSPAVLIRPARPEEYPAVGDLTVRAYVHAGQLDDDSGYGDHLRDAAGRAVGADLLVAVDQEGALLGTVTLVVDAARPYAQVAAEDEAEIRMLAVEPGVQRGGVGLALVEECVRRAAAAGRRRLVLCTRTTMRAAHRLYERMGFRRAPELDWEPAPGIPLVAYALDLPAGGGDPLDDRYCDSCGGELAVGDHAGCARRRALEPPRYCPRCRRRMVVQVTPRGWTARCAEHGVRTG